MARAARVKSRPAERTEIAAVQILGDRHGVPAFAAEDGASVALVLAPNQRLMARQFIMAIYTCIKCVTALESYSHDIASRVVVRTLSLPIDTDTTHDHLTRHKISDRARERAWLRTRRTNYTKATHRSGGTVRCIAWLDASCGRLIARTQQPIM